MMTRRLALLFVAVLGLSCAAKNSSNYRPGDPRLTDAVLEIVGPATFTLRYEENAPLQVRYFFDDGTREPIYGAPLQWEIVGTAGGATLPARTVDTNADGLAGLTLHAGVSNASFVVRVTPPAGNSVDFLVAVTDTESGSIVIDMTYGGRQTFDEFVPYLFRGQACMGLDPEMLPMAERIGAAVPRLRDRPGFVGVPVGNDYTVAVVAKIAGLVAGFGCTVGVDVMRAKETVARVTILDHALGVRFEGVYDLGNNFDFSGALPESVATALHVLDELTDDQNIDGNAATMDWGQDPGAFVVDFAMRQTCHWECMSGQDYSSCSEINHELGDLRLLYTQNFTSWGGAQSRFFGGCGAWELAAKPAQILVNNQVGTYVPEIVLRFLDAAGDLSRAVTAARIRSVMTLGARRDGVIPMTHELLTMEVRLRDLGGAEHFFTFDLRDAGLSSLTAMAAASSSGETLVIPTHSFGLHFGRLVQYIYLRGLLPLFGYTSTADMLDDWIDCMSVATALYGVSDLLTVAQYQSACEAGIRAAGSFVDTNIAGLIDSEALLTINGTARGTDVSTTGIAQTLDMGVWMGSWDEAGVGDTISGTFTGTRRP